MSEAKWTPLVSLDFFEATGHEFHNAVGKFRDSIKNQPRTDTFSLADGWHTITPEMAEEMLKRNTHNRPLDWPSVLAYGTQMHHNRWKRTGETVIINGNGDVEDAGHRLWACYLSQSAFPSYVVNVEADPDLFAFIDNGRSRNGSDTLTTAGFGKQSGLLSRIIKDIAMPFDERCLSYNGRLPRPPCTNIDILDYLRANPEMDATISTVKDMYPAAIKRLGDTATACFVGWKIQTMFGSGVLEDFFGSLTRTDLGKTNPVAALQRRLDEHLAALASPRGSPKQKMRLTPTKILALTIRAFNLSRVGATTQRLDPRADDPFPDFDTEVGERQAA